jgi:class 3 adenylate cyclase
MPAIIHAVSGEFSSGSLERIFRDQQMRAEVRQIRLIWLLALGFFLVYGPVDYWLFGREVSARELSPRGGILMVGSLVVFSTLLGWGKTHRDLIGFIGLLLVSAAYALLLQRRDSGLGSPSASMLLVVGIYMFSPGRYWMVCASAVFCSAAPILLLVESTSSNARLQYSYLVPANLLAALALAQLNHLRRRSFMVSEKLRREVSVRRRAQNTLAVMHRRSRELLHNALPAVIAQQLQKNPSLLPVREHATATVLFADLVGFSTLSRQLGPRRLLQLLNSLFSSFDVLALEYGLEKIKTVGDAYLAVAGVTEGPYLQQERAARMGLALLDCCDLAASQWGLGLRLRIGIHSGPLVAGVIGRQRLAFDIWGETVNVAARLQTASAPGRILVSDSVRQACPGQFLFGCKRRLLLRGCGHISASTLYSQASVLQRRAQGSYHFLRG